MADLREQLADHALIGLDTSIFIYHFEAHPTYKPLTEIILQGIQAGEREAVLSTVSLMELTVHPWRQGRADIARHYEALLNHFPHLQLVDITRDAARQAAQLRARYHIRPADALNVAAALVHNATAYLTNDKGLTRLAPLLHVLVLDSFVGE
jgi:predicted nucleic acid-binding protein